MKQNTKGFALPLIIITVLGILFVSLVIYRENQKRHKEQLPENKPTPTQPFATPILEQSSPISFTATNVYKDTNGKEVRKITVKRAEVTSFVNFEFELPVEWNIEVVKAPALPDYVATTLKISKGKNSITLRQDAIGGGVCVFDDTDQKLLTPPDMYEGVEKINKYTEFSFMDRKFRRILASQGNQVISGKVVYQICAQENGKDSLFINPLPIGILDYEVEKNNSAILKEMDSILGTVRYI